MIFSYAAEAHTRRHGPRGYVDYHSFKEWLRDEFGFACAYCLCRERWYPLPADAFGADHVIPQSADATRANDYDNLVCACNGCNARKQHARGLPSPRAVGFGNLLRVNPDGTIVSGEPDGIRLIRILKLDEPYLVEYRSRMFALFADSSAETRRRWFGFPDDLPDLRRLRPPGENSRRAGIEELVRKARAGGTT